MKRYRPKPKKDVEACQYTGSEESFKELRAWLGKSFYYDYQNAPRVFFDAGNGFPSIGIEDGFWIIKTDEDEPGNEYVVMRDDQFIEVYKAV